MLKLKIMVFAMLTALLGACTGRAAEVPGDLANPKLAELVSASLAEQVRRMNPVWSPGLIAQAPDNARLWLQEIAEVVARCKYGPRNKSKFNLIEYDITLRSGEVVRDVYSGQRCLYDVSLPLVMRVRFEGGRAVEVLTDGRERKAPVEAAMNEINQFAESVVRADWQRRAARYFPPGKTAAEIAREWGSDKKP